MAQFIFNTFVSVYNENTGYYHVLSRYERHNYLKIREEEPHSYIKPFVYGEKEICRSKFNEDAKLIANMYNDKRLRPSQLIIDEDC